MDISKTILTRVKDSVKSQDPKARIIVYGSFARGDNREESDLDLLILVDKNPVTRADEKRIKYPLYDIEFDSGQLISPLVFSKSEWESRHRITPFYRNIQTEGIEL